MRSCFCKTTLHVHLLTYIQRGLNKKRQRWTIYFVKGQRIDPDRTLKFFQRKATFGHFPETGVEGKWVFPSAKMLR